MKMWLVGQVIEKVGDNIAWEFAGVFSTEEKAIAACRTNQYFVAQVTLDEEIPEETTEWPDAHYPLAAAR